MSTPVCPPGECEECEARLRHLEGIALKAVNRILKKHGEELSDADVAFLCAEFVLLLVGSGGDGPAAHANLYATVAESVQSFAQNAAMVRDAPVEEGIPTPIAERLH